MTLSEILKAGRKSQKLSLPQAAAAFGVSRDVVRNWECGGAAPKLGVVLLICEVYGVASAALLEAAANAWNPSTRQPIEKPTLVASVFDLAKQSAPKPKPIEVGGGLKFMCVECGKPSSQFGSKKTLGGFRCMACVNSKQMESTC